MIKLTDAPTIVKTSARIFRNFSGRPWNCYQAFTPVHHNYNLLHPHGKPAGNELAGRNRAGCELNHAGQQ
jgi:hypothetical protein